MWKVFCGSTNSCTRWGEPPPSSFVGNATVKMISPGPFVAREPPVRLPFLDVTPSTVLQRIQHGVHKDERTGLTLWTSDALDLSRGNASAADIGGYRGVYLGKIRQGSAIRRSTSLERGFNILPSKYGSSGADSRGSAIGAKSNGVGSSGRVTSPQLMSPGQHRKKTSLVPLDQAHRSSKQHLDDGAAVNRSATPAAMEAYDDNEVIEEEFETIPEESRAGSSSTTRDSGVSLPSNNSSIDEPHPKEKRKVIKMVEEHGVFVPSQGSSGSIHEDGHNSYDFGDPRLREFSSPSTHSLPIGNTYARHKSKIPIIQTKSRGRASRNDVSKSNKPAYGDNEYESDFESDDDQESRSDSKTPLDLKKVREDTMRDIQKRMMIAKAEGEEIPDLGMTQRFSRSTYKGLGPTSLLRLDSELDKRERASRKETRHAKELRERKFRQLQYEMRQPGDANFVNSPLNVNSSTNTNNRLESRQEVKKKSPRPIKKSNLKPADAVDNSNRQKLSPRPSPTPRLSPSPKPSPRPSPRSSPIRNRRLRNRRPSLEAPGSRQRVNRIPKSKSHDRGLSKIQPDKPLKRHGSLDRSRGGLNSTRLTLGSQGSSRRGLGSSLSRGSAMTVNIENNPELEQIVARLETARVRSTKPMSTTFSREITRPFNKPEAALQEVKDNLQSDDWEVQLEGIQGTSRLALFHPDILRSSLHEVNIALLKHGRNLRSQVCRCAVQSFVHLFDSFQRAMEPDLEKIANLLFNKTVETNKFLREDANNALDALVEAAIPSKALPILIQEGLHHRNPVVRTVLARLLAYIVERVGAPKVLNQKDIAEKLLPAAAKLAQEGSLETRTWAKTLFQRLAINPGFTDSMKRNVSSTDINHLKKFLDNLFTDSRNTPQDSARTKSNVGSRYSRTM